MILVNSVDFQSVASDQPVHLPAAVRSIDVAGQPPSLFPHVPSGDPEVRVLNFKSHLAC